MRLTLRSALLFLLAIVAGCMIAVHTTPGVGGVIVYAQAVPTVVHAQWTPNPAADNVSSYTLTIDGGAPITVAPTLDATCGCVQAPVTLAAFGAHTVTVAAVNLLVSTDPNSGQQSSAPTAIAFSLNKAPAAVAGALVKR